MRSFHKKRNMKNDFKERFLTNTDDTGRFIVKSLVTGKIYFVEPINNANRPSDWGDVNVVTKKLTGHYGEKYKGAVTEFESMITKENGFDKIHDIPAGTSPLSYIEQVDKQHQKEMEKNK